MTYLIEIDEDACAAHGDCVDVAPEVFELDDVARVIGTGPDELLLEAAEACPSTAIRIIDPETERAGLPVARGGVDRPRCRSVVAAGRHRPPPPGVAPPPWSLRRCRGRLCGSAGSAADRRTASRRAGAAVAMAARASARAPDAAPGRWRARARALASRSGRSAPAAESVDRGAARRLGRCAAHLRARRPRHASRRGSACRARAARARWRPTAARTESPICWPASWLADHATPPSRRSRAAPPRPQDRCDAITLATLARGRLSPAKSAARRAVGSRPVGSDRVAIAPPPAAVREHDLAAPFAGQLARDRQSEAVARRPGPARAAAVEALEHELALVLGRAPGRGRGPRSGRARWRS